MNPDDYETDGIPAATEDGLRTALAQIELLRTSSNRQGSPVDAFMDGVEQSAAILRAALARSTPAGLDVEALIRVLQAPPYHWNEYITHDLREAYRLTQPAEETP